MNDTKLGKNNSNSIELLSIYRGALMGLATMLIFIFHECRTVFSSGIIHDSEAFLISIGYYGVDIFLLLSGMGLYYSLERNSSVVEFYKKRALRILPAYYLAGLVVFFIRKWTAVDLIKHLSGYSFFAINTDSFLWFPIFIIVVYLIFPWLYKILKKSKNELLALTVIYVVYEVLFFVLSPYIRADFIACIERIAIILFGVMIAILIRKHPYKFNWYVWVLLVLILFAGISLEYFKQNYQVLLIPRISSMLPEFMMAVPTAYLFAGLLSKTGKTGIVLNKIFTFIGKFSFEFYLVQGVLGARVFYLVYKFNNLTKNILVFILLGSIACIIHFALDFVIKKAGKYVGK